MDNYSEIIQWFKRMGYDGEIPKSLGNIYNQSTLFIWNALMQNTKPKQEIDNLRNNIIIHRLRSKELSKQNEFSYPIKEIDLYIKKQYLKKKLSNLNNSVNEKKHKLSNISQSNKMKYITIEKLKAKVKENEEREYLLNKKSKMLEKNIQEADETLSFAKNLTPVELEENPNTKEITETLEKCAEKLEKLFPEISPASNSQLNSTHKSFRMSRSVQKQHKTQTTFEKYLIMSERKYMANADILKRGGPSAKKVEGNKENLGRERTVSKKLFDTSSEPIKRESLGLLPDNCLSDGNEDYFLQAPKKVQHNNLSPDLLTLKEISIINSNTMKEMHSFDLSLNSLLNDNPKSEIPTQSTLCHNQKQPGIEKLYDNQFIANALKKLLYNHNRHFIWQTIQNLNDDLSLDFTKNIIFETGKAEKGKSISRDDIAKLQSLHVQTEIQTLKLKAVAKQVSRQVVKKKKSIYAELANQGLSAKKIEEVGRLFEQQLEDVGLDTVLGEMKKEINSAKKVEDNGDLHVTVRKYIQVKDDIDLEIASIKRYISSIHEIFLSMIQTKETTVACVQKLGPFIEDLTWSLPLTQNLCSIETKTFEKFPLEYNRRCVYTDLKTYYRDIANNIPTDIELDSDSVYMLTNILESPFSPPETVLLNILKSKMKLDMLKSLQNCSRDFSYEKYSLQELQAQESYIQYALNKLNSLVYSTSSSKTLATADFAKKVMDIWLEMPMKDFISPNRIVEDKDYKYYEKLYDSFYNNL